MNYKVSLTTCVLLYMIVLDLGVIMEPEPVGMLFIRE